MEPKKTKLLCNWEYPILQTSFLYSGYVLIKPALNLQKGLEVALPSAKWETFKTSFSLCSSTLPYSFA